MHPKWFKRWNKLNQNLKHKKQRKFLNHKLQDISRQSMNFSVETAFLPTIKDIETKQKIKFRRKQTNPKFFAKECKFFCTTALSQKCREINYKYKM